MKTNSDFEYDLWKEKDTSGNNIKYFFRIKKNGEYGEIDKETFNFLNAEAIRIYRMNKGIPVFAIIDDKKVVVAYIPVLSLTNIQLNMDETIDTDNKNIYYIADSVDVEDVVLTGIIKEEISSLITTKQLDVFEKCIVNGISYSDYAKKNNVSEAAVSKLLSKIRRATESYYDN